MILEKTSRILVLAPHTDDGEFGCGGIISRFIEEKRDVYYISFSFCEDNVPKRLPKDILASESASATKSLGIKKDNIIAQNYPVRRFDESRQEILDFLVKIKKKIKPNLVLIPSTTDIHQDHQVISREGVRAFKHTTLLGYELPWNTIEFQPAVYISLKKRHINKKVASLRQYRSQQRKIYAAESFLRGLARTRGVQAGVEFAEAFEVVRMYIR